jgi:hypothetical protein
MGYILALLGEACLQLPTPRSILASEAGSHLLLPLTEEKTEVRGTGVVSQVQQ